LLITLLQRDGEMVTRSDLHRVLWDENVFVDFDKGLTVAITKLRAALSDSSENPKYIETILGEGYRFIAEVEHVYASSSPRSAVSETGQDTVRPPMADSGPIHLASTPLEDPHRGFWIPKNRFPAVIAVCIALLIAGGTMPAWRRMAKPLPVPPAKIMLVVLPFENLSGDPGQEYLSDGITEELSQKLGNLSPHRLGVIGRTSAMTYKHSTRTISQIGKELSISYVLEGSVRREGSKLRVTAQLVEVSDQAHVWAQNYDGQVLDLLQVEDDIASDIAQRVGVAIALGQPPNPMQPHIPNAEAHDYYLLARYYWNKRTPAGWSSGEQYFRRAIDKDPQYAAAYAGLAESRISKDEAMGAAKKAVELDPRSGEAYTALGWVELFRNLNVRAAESALKTAVQLDPNYAPAHHTYSGVMQISGRIEDAITEEKRAIVLDPLAPIFRASLAEMLSLAGHYGRGLQELNQIFAMDPQFPKAHETLGVLYLRKGMYEEAIREFGLSERFGGDQQRGLLGYAYARCGKKEEALKILLDLRAADRKSGSGSVSNDLAMVQTGLGNLDEALAWLEKEYQQHDDDGLLALAGDPMFDPLRRDPRFQDLLRRMGLPQ
jgi:TolB-like protein/DNA-binding winged helix-turn-helix (wHTH) protein/Flp pilus assembly protein TadD